MKKFEGKYPANARVDIDYSNGKPKVKFSYPKNGLSAKQQAQKQHSIGTHTAILILLGYLSIFIIPICSYYSSPMPTNCYANFNNNTINVNLTTEINGKLFNSSSHRQYIDYFNLTCDNKTTRYNFEDKNNNYFSTYANFKESKDNHKNYDYLKLIVIILLIIFVVNKLLTKLLLTQNWYKKSFPERQAKKKGILGIFNRKKKKYISFKVKDIINNELIIPQFSNVELDYKTSGDFSNQLKKIIIREKVEWIYDVKLKKPTKKIVDCYKWYARFIFIDKPKNGKLEVVYI